MVYYVSIVSVGAGVVTILRWAGPRSDDQILAA